MNVLITGASGFVGRELVTLIPTFVRVGIIGTYRTRNNILPPAQSVFFSLASDNCPTDFLARCDVVIHAAGDSEVGEQFIPEAYRRNVDGTVQLAALAAGAGVRRFIFLSSVKVNGQVSRNGHPFCESDLPNPSDYYSQIKLEAERRLFELCTENGMELVIIRMPLVYGPQVGGNFKRLVRLVSVGMPLPILGIRNKRSLLSTYNLAHFLSLCLDHPMANGRVFFVSDGVDFSTAEICREIAAVMEVPVRQFYVPTLWINFLASICGMSSISTRIFDSLQVDITRARTLLNWEAPLSLQDGIRRCLSFKGYEL